ncbi:hypothetical protein VUR80DRAFT_4682 [Thermomyces stellatus]
MPPITAREEAPGPVAPVPAVRSTCSGWACLNDAEQFGVLFSVVVTVTILGVIFTCYIKTRRAERDFGVELLHVRLPRELRQRDVSPILVMPSPAPAYQAVQVPHSQYFQPRMHIQAPPGATTQPYAAGPGVLTPVVCALADAHPPPTGFNGLVPNPYYVPQPPISQTPAGAAPFHEPQAGAYVLDWGTGPWHTPSIRHMSAAPQPTKPPKPTLRQWLMSKFRLPMGHVSTVTGSPPTPRNASRASSPHPPSASCCSSPARPSAGRLTRSARDKYRRSARTVSPGPRRSMYSCRYASPRPRPRSQSPYVHQKTVQYRFSPDKSSSPSSSSTSSSGSGSSTEAVVRGRSRASDRT